MIIEHTIGEVVREIDIIETDVPPRIVRVDRARVFMNSADFEGTFIVREVVYNMLVVAAANLPPGVRFKLGELYRPRAKQLAEWDAIYSENATRHPDWDGARLERETERFIANPHKAGSGHQTAAAVDLTLCRDDGAELDMGTAMNELSPLAETFVASVELSAEARANRATLYNAMVGVGFVNYPFEWWHYSYGELEWAHLSGRGKTLFAALDL
ncbi:MAG: hypothetical protein LBL52_03850 [Rickettsiales bacterium]|nr:hypothetical protein [Rickettsiales bacterium]